MRFTRLVAMALVCLPLAAAGQGFPGGGPSILGNASQFRFDPTGTGCLSTSTDVQTTLEELCDGGGGGGGGGSPIDCSINGSSITTGLESIACTNATSICSESPTDGLTIDFSPLLLATEADTKAEINSLISDGDVVTAISGDTGTTTGTAVAIEGTAAIDTAVTGNIVSISVPDASIDAD